MPTRADQFLAVTLALLLHAFALLAFWLGRDWEPDAEPAAAGPVISATLQFTAADVRAAQAAVAAAKAARPPEPTPPPPPQPRETPRPQEAVEPPQMQPQAPLERPDTVDQEEITRVAPLPSDAIEEQRRREMQKQVDLTEELERQRDAENRERLREQYEAIRREREEATRLTRMEEQRLAQLADRQAASPQPAPAAPATPPSGSRGTDAGLIARYKAAMHATANDNWNRGLAPELVACHVRFQQIPGGEVINVEFIDCPYDAQGRESVERALRKTPMPYSGFEPVFMPKVILTFCYPEEACIR